jgi:hypothetical protein
MMRTFLGACPARRLRGGAGVGATVNGNLRVGRLQPSLPPVGALSIARLAASAWVVPEGRGGVVNDTGRVARWATRPVLLRAGRRRVTGVASLAPRLLLFLGMPTSPGGPDDHPL